MRMKTPTSFIGKAILYHIIISITFSAEISAIIFLFPVATNEYYVLNQFIEGVEGNTLFILLKFIGAYLLIGVSAAFILSLFMCPPAPMAMAGIAGFLPLSEWLRLTRWVFIYSDRPAYILFIGVLIPIFASGASYLGLLARNWLVKVIPGFKIFDQDE